MAKSQAAYGHARKPKVEIDGIKFMSPGEAERYLELCIMQAKGQIVRFDLQPKFPLQKSFRKNGEFFREINYFADFRVFYNGGRTEVEDVKGWGGYTTPEFKIKRKLFEYQYPTLRLIMLKRKGKQVDALLKERATLLATRGSPNETTE